ncbi:MAG: cation:proton antiporter subunit C [Defluviitaleaceae bacterium]|nr:cation:proton antiporter subunit C [Defluviitaleaceae bacterium]MCL2836727.1 cation:proton antiporter subunit C [Defluviitaleaceae bacterium]
MDIFSVEYMEIFSIALFFLAYFGIITSKNIIKSIIFIMLMQTAAVMFWLKLGAETSAMPAPPIIYEADLLERAVFIADPLPQALTLTAIIIGFSVIAIIITMLNTLYRHHRTTDWGKLEKLVQ